ncbi:MAG: hypothetical protein M3O35_06225 [Acidobacteriota bacterium]|nr:hypothetical protein [Acidobacteriota bacterium]
MLKRIAHNPWLACGLVALLALAGRMAMLPWVHVPAPAVHDEFSYLLASDTYASGRVTNPPHPMWEHFETFHVLQQPTYASKYPPLPGLMMALGQRFFGTPWVGVWLGVGLMCAATCWMLRGWISPGWAMLGGLLLATRIGFFTYWIDSYWGGAVAAAGGALVLGAMPRIARERRIRDAVIFAIGLVVLMNSRPYEGFVLAALASIALGWWLWKDHAGRRLVAVRILLPVILVITPALGAMAYQNWRVTGNALLLPYVAHDRQYAATSLFLWSHSRSAPVYRHAELRRYWAGWQVDVTEKARQDVAGQFWGRLGYLYQFFFGLWPVLAVALIWPYRLQTREERWTALILGIALVVTVAPLAGILPHYAAPLTALLYLRLLQGLSRLPAFRPSGWPVGLVLLGLVLAGWSAQLGYDFRELFLHGDKVPQLAWDRSQVIRQIDRVPGDHLVVVHFSPTHDVHQEWIANAADIDRSHIVWAREMGLGADAPLLAYYHSRHAWLLDADANPPRIQPYPGSEAPKVAAASEALPLAGR